jgi:hypothetical protein
MDAEARRARVRGHDCWHDYQPFLRGRIPTPIRRRFTDLQVDQVLWVATPSRACITSTRRQRFRLGPVWKWSRPRRSRSALSSRLRPVLAHQMLGQAGFFVRLLPGWTRDLAEHSELNRINAILIARLATPPAQGGLEAEPWALRSGYQEPRTAGFGRHRPTISRRTDVHQTWRP